MSTVNQAVPSQPSFMTKLVFTFPYEVPYRWIYQCKKMLFEGLKIDGEVVICEDYWGCYTPSIQKLREKLWKCYEEPNRLWYEKLDLTRKLEEGRVIFGVNRIRKKIDELNRLYEEKSKLCEPLYKEFDEKVKKLQSELRKVFHEKLFDMILKPYLMTIHVTDEEVSKIRSTWLDTTEIVAKNHTSMAIPIPKGFYRVSLSSNTYGTTPPYIYTTEIYTVEIYTSYDYHELGAFISTLKRQYRDLMNAGCFTISTDVIESETSNATNYSSTS